jgi:23S rRNA-intervening sequence protein
MKDQLRRAVLSIMLNIAEGFGRRTHKEFKHFLFMAHGSVKPNPVCMPYTMLAIFQKRYLKILMKNVMKYLKLFPV